MLFRLGKDWDGPWFCKAPTERSQVWKEADGSRGPSRRPERRAWASTWHGASVLLPRDSPSPVAHLGAGV